MKITRQQIIDALGNELKNNSFVFAFWLEGADAHDRVDEFSDMDVWLDVQDGHEGMVIEQVQSILSKIAPLDFEYEKDHPHPKIRQKFFHLKDTSEFLIIDVCVQSHSREFWYTKEHADEKIKIIFEKEKVIEFRNLDKIEFQSLQRKRAAELKKTYLFFQVWVKKGVNRGNFLEALEYYYSFILEPLVELLRIRYEPTKREFGLKHIERDLPKAILQTIEDLYKVNSTSEISTKSQKANELFLVISVFRNHEELKYPYGNKAKERFRVRGQLFERKKVHLVRIIQDKQNGSRVCEMQIMQEAKKSENDPYRDWYRHRLLPTATCISIGKRS